MAKGPSRRDVPSSAIAQRRANARDMSRRGYSARRAEIVAAAAKVFKERGFGGTTLSHVAEALGTDRASLYYYFASKEELFEEVVGQAVAVNVEAAKAIRDQPGDAPDKLRRLLVAVMESYDEYYPVLYLVIQENLSQVAPGRSEWAARIRRSNNEFVDVLIDILRAGQEEGTLRATAPPWLEAYGLMGMVGWTNRWFNPSGSSLSATEIGEAFADMVLQGLTDTSQPSRLGEAIRTAPPPRSRERRRRR